MCKLQRVAKTRTTLLNPQPDGMVEHFNRTLEAQLSRITNKTGISRNLSQGCYSCCHSWRLHIQIATYIIIICKTMIPSTPVGMLSGGIKTMRTPASSPDLNPIEHIWHTVREFLHNEYKPPKRYKNIFGITNSRNL